MIGSTEMGFLILAPAGFAGMCVGLGYGLQTVNRNVQLAGSGCFFGGRVGGGGCFCFSDEEHHQFPLVCAPCCRIQCKFAVSIACTFCLCASVICSCYLCRTAHLYLSISRC